MILPRILHKASIYAIFVQDAKDKSKFPDENFCNKCFPTQINVLPRTNTGVWETVYRNA